MKIKALIICIYLLGSMLFYLDARAYITAKTNDYAVGDRTTCLAAASASWVALISLELVKHLSSNEPAKW
jgi:hypothetical protein